jgi:hypothetical protein
MKNVFLVKEGDRVLVFYSEMDMHASDYTKATRTVTEEEFNSNGCYARVINGEIVIGKTDTEKQVEDLTNQIADIDSQLEALDSKYLTPRILSGIGFQDSFALEQAQKHNAAATPLREQRAVLQSSLDRLLGEQL